MRLLFARHGESEANVDRVFSNRGWGHPLTPAGREQARVLAESDLAFTATVEAELVAGRLRCTRWGDGSLD